MASERTDGPDRAFATADGGEDGALRAAVEASAAGLAVVEDGTVTAGNGAAERFLGADAVGRPAAEVFPERVAEAVESACAAAGSEQREAGTVALGGRPGAVSVRSASVGRAVVTVTEPSGGESGQRSRIADERELLATVNRAIAGAESFAEGVETALEAVCDLTHWAYGEAWTPAAAGDRLEFLVGHAAAGGFEPLLSASRETTFAAGEGLPGRVWASASPEWLPDASAEPTDVFHRAETAANVGLQAVLGVPITVDDGEAHRSFGSPPRADDAVVAVLLFGLDERRPADEELVEVVTDVAADLGRLVAHKRTEDALERERSLLSRIFETSPTGLVVTKPDGTVVRANSRAGAAFETAASDLLGRPFEAAAETFRSPSGDRLPPEALPVARARETGSAVELECEVERTEAEDAWLRISAAPIAAGDGTVERVVVAVEDVTDHREREQSLRAFQAAVDQAGHSIYFTDLDGTIQYVNPTFEQITGYSAGEAVGEDPEILNSGEHDDAFFGDLWATILDGEVWTGEVINQRKSGEQYVVNQTIAPITDDGGEIERFVAINDEITDQKRRERTLRRQRNSLERIKRIIESLRPINRELVRAGTREDIDRAVCEQLTTAETYLFAWIGEYNAATGELTPREWAGVDEEFVQDLAGPLEEGAGDLYERAVTEQSVQIRQEVTMGGPEQRDRALTYGFQSQAVVPVVYGDTVHGVIGVYSARPEAFDEYERGLLAELGERIGHAINAAEHRQLLHTDTVVELEFDVGATAPLTAVARECDCRLSVDNVTPGSDGAYVCYAEVDGREPAALAEALEARSEVERARAVTAHGETGVVEATVTAGPLATLLEHGASLQSFTVTDDGATLLAESAPQSDTEPLITDLTEGDTEFVAKRTRERAVRTLQTTKSAVEAALTDRQQEALTLAYHAGYFASPRDSTGEELADALGIAAPTFYRHVRKGTRKVLGLLVDAEDASTPALSR